MKTDIDLKTLWRQQDAVMPDEKEIVAKAASLKKRVRNKLIFSVVILLLTAVFILIVLFTSNLQMRSTKLGITLVIAGILMMVTNSTKIIFSLQTPDSSTNNGYYLQQLLKLKQQQEFTQTKLMVAYFIFLSAGLALYMYEPTLKMSNTGKIIAYAVTFTWIAFNWFYLMPRSIRKQKAKINLVIEKLQSLTHDIASEK